MAANAPPSVASTSGARDAHTDVLQCPYQGCTSKFRGRSAKGNLLSHIRQKHADSPRLPQATLQTLQAMYCSCGFLHSSLNHKHSCSAAAPLLLPPACLPQRATPAAQGAAQEVFQNTAAPNLSPVATPPQAGRPRWPPRSAPAQAVTQQNAAATPTRASSRQPLPPPPPPHDKLQPLFPPLLLHHSSKTPPPCPSLPLRNSHR